MIGSNALEANHGELAMKLESRSPLIVNAPSVGGRLLLAGGNLCILAVAILFSCDSLYLG